MVLPLSFCLAPNCDRDTSDVHHPPLHFQLPQQSETTKLEEAAAGDYVGDAYSEEV
jgi:hypothetical protein